MAESSKAAGMQEDRMVAWQRNGMKGLIKKEYVCPLKPMLVKMEEKLILLIRHSGFQSKIFTITVGKEEVEVFTAHEAHLSQSPAFERMCNAAFKEKQTLQISLPDDPPQSIAAIIQYLYTGNISNSEPQTSWEHDEDNPEDPNVTAEKKAEYNDILAETYITAEKYDLQDLKTLLVKKIAVVTDILIHPTLFLNTARKIYARIPDCYDDVYRDFVRKQALMLPRPNDMEDVRKTYDECISEGGPLALDLVAALCDKYAEAEKELRQTLDAKCEGLL
ncbi:MAG: hypothetical protein Q9218_004679 [Villophora microphyllina]